MKKYKISIAIFAIIIAGFLLFRNQVFNFFQKDNSKTISISNIEKSLSENKEQSKVEIEEKKKEEVTAENKQTEKLPASILLEMPFLSQAPFQKWDALHEDACEEASYIMVKYFLEGKKKITLEEGEQEIQKMIAFEEKNGYGISITLQELGRIGKNFYGLQNYRIETNITVENIKQELAKGNLVIVGAAGKVLQNPNFRNGGPNYHMLVIKGYDEKSFITNDPGTRLGEGFRYTFENMITSIHNWNPKDIMAGEKAYLVVEK